MPRRTVAHTVVLALLSGLYPVAAQAGEGGPTVVKVQRDATGYHLLRDGRPYVIKGGGGRVYLEALKFAVGSKEQALPEGFPRSVEVVVTHR